MMIITELEFNCETGQEVQRTLTDTEVMTLQVKEARAEAERAAREAEEAAKQAEREALSAWLLSRSDLTDGARAAILRAMGVAETAGSV